MEENEKIINKYKISQSLVGTSAGRPDNDYYVTPRNAVEALLNVERFEKAIYEPACGNGAISKVLIENGYDVISSDLIDRGYGYTGIDFFNTPYKAENIITNPPFALAEAFLRKSINDTTGKVAFLLKLQFLEGQKRKIMFEELPLKTVHVFSKRIQMGRNGEQYGSSMMAFAWFIFDHSYKGLPYLNWI